MPEETNQLLVNIIGNQLLEIARTQSSQGAQITRSAALLEELVGTAINPGRLPKIETKVEALHADALRLRGIGIAWASVLSICAIVIPLLITYYKSH